MLNLAVLNVGSPRMSTHETALKLLHLLDARFLQEDVVFDTPRPPQQPLNDVLLATVYCSAQMSLSEQLAALHTDLTMPMFSGGLVERGWGVVDSWCGRLLGTNRFLIRVCVRAVFRSMMPGPDHDHVLRWVGGAGMGNWGGVGGWRGGGRWLLGINRFFSHQGVC